MALEDRIHRKLAARAQPFVDKPIITAANFHWPVVWQTKSSATAHPELAGGLPEVVLIALTDTDIHLFAPPVGKVSHSAKDGDLVVIGSWPRWQITVERIDKPMKILGKEMPTVPQIQLSLPGRESALLTGAQGATPSFAHALLEKVAPPAAPAPPAPPALPPMEFGDGLTLIQPDGTEIVGRYLAGPRLENGSEVYWACDWHEWDNATVREGRDPDGTAYPPDRIRPLS